MDSALSLAQFIYGLLFAGGLFVMFLTKLKGKVDTQDERITRLESRDEVIRNDISSIKMLLTKIETLLSEMRREKE